VGGHLDASLSICLPAAIPFILLEMSTPTPRPYSLDEIRFIREEVKFQHTLIGTRISWFVGAQAFLVTPFAICISNQLSRTFFLAFAGIPFLGIALSLLIVQGIRQAIVRIEQQHVRMQAYQTDHLIGPPDPIGQKRSLQFATWVPWIFLTFWSVIVLIGIAIRFARVFDGR
jgi:bacteriorhodopsin